MTDVPTTRAVLGVLTKSRLVDLARDLEIAVSATGKKEAQIEALLASGRFVFRGLVEKLGRDELRAACQSFGLEATSRSRIELAAALLKAHGATDSVPPRPLFATQATERYLPHEKDIVQVRHRQWLVERVTPGAEGEATQVSLVCLDDDNAGQTLEVLWELELGAEVIQPETRGLGDISRFDAPHAFGAYLLSLRWNLVTATDAKRFQSPFRAGIKILTHQLTPLRKALALPRANLFIADDVGLGKTIEAGLVLSELTLRQRVDFALIVCPASVAVQWKGEMESRFGLRFELYTRAFVSKCHRERGFAKLPWETFNRFIITYHTLRRPDYIEPLLQHLGDRKRKSMLILDEAHTIAPASDTTSKYAVDSAITLLVREQLAPRFDNRLFLSATPHNGHSNSFSALLEILDPARFTRGIKPSGPEALEPVMVRRLKSDLRQIPNTGKFPERIITRIEVGDPHCPEVVLSEKLAEYTELVSPQRGRGRLVFINLQKRLLSSVQAFANTLEVHAEGAMVKKLGLVTEVSDEDEDEEDADETLYGESDDAETERNQQETFAQTQALGPVEGRGRTLLAELRTLAAKTARHPDAKAKALAAWIHEHQCKGASLDPRERDAATKKDRQWNERRVIIFTEYADTKKMLVQLLRAAISETDRADDRVLELSGGMGDDRRAAVQASFNGKPSEHPVRILVCTDAAREGINLQAYCADLFHFDVPWNPGRMEQRNGRIDRTLQPATEVRCHYFHYRDRKEDRVLDVLVHKVETIRRELGSLGVVLAEQVDKTLRGGIGKQSAALIEGAVELPEPAKRVKSELEGMRAHIKDLKAEIDDAGTILASSRKILAFKPELLHKVIDQGLALAGCGPLVSIPPTKDSEEARFALPPLSNSWSAILDGMRPPRGHDELEHVWRKRPPRLVVFDAPEVWSESNVHLHLEHPFVQRILSRFRAQGFSAHDLSRVTVLPTREHDEVRAVAFGRLSLFGAKATRLHDELIVVAAPWFDSGRKGHLVPTSTREDEQALKDIETSLLLLPTVASKRHKVLEQALLPHAAPDFAALWRHVHDEADARAKVAENALKNRGRDEAAAMLKLLEAQGVVLERELGAQQLGLEFKESERDQRRQWEDDRRHQGIRFAALKREKETEPKAIQELYEVVRRRLVPVGLVYLWPEARG